jgi:hypothetical protein
MSALTAVEPATASGEAGELLAQVQKALGLTPSEVVGNLALNVLTNYFNILAGVENDWPAVKPARAAA